jgi:hypothetical protein
VAHQPIYPNGEIHKVDFECRGDHCRGFVAPECFRNFQLPLHHPRGEVSLSFSGEKTSATDPQRESKTKI